MGPRDNGWTTDDGSSCAGQCGKKGFCRADKCVCVALWEGATCALPKVGTCSSTAVDSCCQLLTASKPMLKTRMVSALATMACKYNMMKCFHLLRRYTKVMPEGMHAVFNGRVVQVDPMLIMI